MAQVTAFPDLNALLEALVRDVQQILGSNLCGVYLQGSFAIGDADEHSDVDFVIVTQREVTEAQLAALQAMHARLHALDVPWAKHLEGSYIPNDHLRQVDAERRPFLYLDNGASRLVWDPHCNTAVVRWILRERGRTLVGPDPAQLVDPISAAALHREGLIAIQEYADYARAEDDEGEMSHWKQAYLVLTCCRILWTLQRGTVTSKRRAGEWALNALDPSWSALIQRALDDRPDPWGRVHRLADPALAASTLAFVDYALAESRRPEPPVLD